MFFFDNDDDQANDDRMNANAIYDDDITFKGDYINLDYENRIVGGIEVDEGEFDFMVSWGGLCGASLIHDQLVLSAAHCHFIRRGVRIRSIYEDRGGITRSIVSRHIHPQYNNTRYENNDFIILELDQPVPNARSSIIELNDDRLEPTRDEILTVIGWGLTSEGGTASEKLLKVGLPAKSHRDCRRVYGPLLNEDIHLCAGFDDGGRDSCQGDSGGPIFSQREDGSNVQVGLVSFGAGCARPRVPGVYSRVSGAYDWIQDKICELATVNRPALCNNRTPQPTPLPTQQPTRPPTRFPTRPPTPFPTQRPTRPPTRFPTRLPTQFPTRPPSRSPTRGPIETPTTQQQSSTDSRMPTRQLPQDFNFNFSFLSSLISKNMNKMKNKNPTTTPTGTPTLTPTTTTQLVSSSFCNREGWNCTEGAICVDDLVCRCDDGYMPNPNLPNSVIVWAGFISCVVDDADALP